jgi:hypothetical protein
MIATQVGCGGSNRVASTAASPPRDPPSGWWESGKKASVPDAPNSGIRFAVDGIVFASATGEVGRMPGKLRVREANRWEWVFEGKSQFVCALEQAGAKGHLRCTMKEKVEEAEIWPASAELSAKLDDVVAKDEPPQDACERFAKCCPDVAATLGADPVTMECAKHGDSARKCFQALKDLRLGYVQVKKATGEQNPTLPESCR